MKKSMPDFLTYLSSLSMSIAAATTGIIAPASADAAPAPDIQTEQLKLSPEASDKVVALADRTLDTDRVAPQQPWTLFAQWGVDETWTIARTTNQDSSSFVDALEQVKS